MRMGARARGGERERSVWDGQGGKLWSGEGYAPYERSASRLVLSVCTLGSGGVDLLVYGVRASKVLSCTVQLYHMNLLVG